MTDSLRIQIVGEEVTLWPARALHWTAGRTLFIADPHFGKAAAFRAVGIAAPDGTSDDLARLDELLERSDAERLVVLGDFFHARRGLSVATLQALGEWRDRHPQLQVTLVKGNHDVKAGRPPVALRIETVEEPWILGPWCCRHRPGESADRHVLSGHVHPGVSLRDRNGTGLRAACFVSGPGLTVLPAFGRFTGLELVRPGTGQRIFAVGADAIFELGNGSSSHRGGNR